MDTVNTWRFLGASLPVPIAGGDLAGWVVGALILAGAALLLLETVLPGLIAGVLGLICLLSGVIVGYAKFGAPTGNLILLGVSAGLVVGTLAWMKYFPSSRIAKVFCLGDNGRRSRRGETGTFESDGRDPHESPPFRNRSDQRTARRCRD